MTQTPKELPLNVFLTTLEPNDLKEFARIDELHSSFKMNEVTPLNPLT